MKRVVMITGAAGGIGKGIAKSFLLEGCQVIIADIKKEEAMDTVNELKNQGGEAFYEYCDLADKDSIIRLVQDVEKKFGRIDVLVNNAAVPSRKSFMDVSIEHWEFVNKVNLQAVYLLSQKVAELMIREKYGKIINIASLRAIFSDDVHPVYAITKAGVVSLTANMAVELAKHNINVNAISPGYVVTPMTEHHLKDKDWVQHMKEMIPQQRLLSVDDIANVVTFLASDKASGIVGQNIIVDGGRSIWDVK